MPTRSFCSLALALALLATACSAPPEGEQQAGSQSGDPKDVAGDNAAPRVPSLTPSASPPASPSPRPLVYACSTFVSGSTDIERFEIDFAKSGPSERRLATAAYGRNVTFRWARVIVREGAAPRILLSLTVANDTLEAAASSNATGDPELLDISAGSRDPADLIADKPLALVSCERKTGSASGDAVR